MSRDAIATTAEQLVSDSDYVQLSRLVIEHTWRVDNQIVVFPKTRPHFLPKTQY